MIITLDNNYIVRQNSTLIGFKGEVDARKITFEGLATEGADSYKLRISYDDEEPSYDVPIENGQIIISGSLLRKKGYVQAQVIARATTEDGKYSLVKKSNIFNLQIGTSLSNGEVVPTYEASVEAMEKVIAVKGEAEKAAKSIERTVDGANDAADRAEEAASKTKSAIDNIGYGEVQSYTKSGYGAQNLDSPVKAGQIVAFTALASDKSNLKGMSVYGVKGDTLDSIVTANFIAFGGTTVSAKLTKDYDYLRVSAASGSTSNTTPYTYKYRLYVGDEYGMQSEIADVNASLKSVQETLDKSAQGGSLNHLTCAIFKKVVCIGDSATSGHITGTDKAVYGDNPEFAWPSFLARLTGNEYINLGINGATAKTWISSASGLAKAKLLANKAQAYLIGFGMNEALSGADVGTSADIGSATAETYYRYMSELIRDIAAINADAHIFVQTIPRDDDEKFTKINTAIKDIVSTYQATYNVHCLDLLEYKDLYSIKSITDDYNASHWSAIGYQQFAQILALIWSNYINANVKKFVDVFKIPYADLTPASGFCTIDKPTSAKDLDIDIDAVKAGAYLQMLFSYSGNKFLATYPLGNLGTGKSYTYRSVYAKNDTAVGVVAFTFGVTKTTDTITITISSVKADGVEVAVTPPNYIMTFGK